MSLSTFPDEILLNILYHLEGDRQTTLSVSRTSKHSRALATENEPRIAYTIAQNHMIGPIRFLLEATAPTRLPPSFVWLHSGHARGNAIEYLVNALENADLYTNDCIFPEPRVPSDRMDLRRYLMTMLLAVELCSLSGRTWRDVQRWINLSPRWATGYAYLSQDLIHHVVRMLHLCVKGHDAVMWGTPDAADAWCVLERVDINRGDAGHLTGILCGGMLLSGSRGMVDILSATYESYEHFVAVAKRRLYRHHPGCVQTARSLRKCLRRLYTKYSNLSDKIWDEYESGDEDDVEASTKWCIVVNNIGGWKKAVPNDEAWAQFILDNEWTNAMRFGSGQLRKIDLAGGHLGYPIWASGRFLPRG